MIALLRWLLPGFGVMWIALSLLGAPARGTPPLASLFTRAEYPVLSADVREWTSRSRRATYQPAIEVQGPAGAMAVEGLARGSREGSRALAEEIAARHPPGSLMRVRLADGRVWADRTDWFALAWTIGVALLGGLFAAVGWLLNRALR